MYLISNAKRHKPTDTFASCIKVLTRNIPLHALSNRQTHCSDSKKCKCLCQLQRTIERHRLLRSVSAILYTPEDHLLSLLSLVVVMVVGGSGDDDDAIAELCGLGKVWLRLADWATHRANRWNSFFYSTDSRHSTEYRKT